AADIDIDAGDVRTRCGALEIHALLIDLDAGAGRADPVAPVAFGLDAPRAVVDGDTGAGGIDAIDGTAFLDDAAPGGPVAAGGRCGSGRVHGVEGGGVLGNRVRVVAACRKHQRGRSESAGEDKVLHVSSSKER